MKSKKHAGFSMIELISVIMIMAILTAALAPSLLKYVRKARRTNDIDAAREIVSSFNRAVVAMEDESFGSGDIYLKYDSTLNDPAQTIADIAFDELGGVPESAAFPDYYWRIEYDNTTGHVERVSLTPSAGSAEIHEVYPDNEDFAEGN